MSACIALFGGIVGAGKTTITNFICENKSLFQTSNNLKIFMIRFDDICSIEEQAKLMGTLKGWRNFRSDLLLAAEHLIAENSPSSDSVTCGPLSERSNDLLNKIKSLNCSSSDESPVLYLVEDNFYYRSMRYEWFQVARRVNAGFCQIMLECPLETALQRNSNRGYSIPEQKICMMMDLIEYPDAEHYKWEKYSINLNTAATVENLKIDAIIELIELALLNPAERIITEEKIGAQLICSTNVIHQADISLRRIVSEKIQNMKANSVQHLKDFAAVAVNMRQEILNDIRLGSVQLPDKLVDNIQRFGVDNQKQELEKVLSDLFESILRERNSMLLFSKLESFESLHL